MFPVIDFDDHSAPHDLALRARSTGYAHSGPHAVSPDARSTGLIALPARQHAHRPSAQPDSVSAREPRASVLAPDVPAPELTAPTDATSCHQRLRAEGIGFRVLSPARAQGVRWPIRLTGPVAGVLFEPGDPDETFAVLDCRLALALLEWAKDLRRAGVRRVGYYSIYRPFARIAGGPRVSGHAHGMAIDAARFTLQNGAVLNVLEDWEGRDRGEPPCPTRSDESRAGRLLRAITCSAADRNLFQVVLTPHYNAAHNNHLHLEIKPEVSWTYVR